MFKIQKRPLLTIVVICFFQLVALAISKSKEIPLYLSYEQRLVLSYLVQAAGSTNEERNDLSQRFYNLVLKHAEEARIETVKVHSIEAFLEVFRGEWPNSLSLEEDLKIIESKNPRRLIRYQASNKGLQEQIEKYLQFQQKKVNEVIVRSLLAGADDYVEKNHNDTESRQNWQSMKPEAKKNLTHFFELFENQNRDGTLGFSEFDLQKLQSLLSKENGAVFSLSTLDMVFKISGNHILQSMSMIDRSGEYVTKELSSVGNPVVRRLLSLLIQEYYQKIPLSWKKEIVSQVLGGNIEMKPIDIFSIMVQNSGPTLQKIFQLGSIFPDIPPELESVLVKLQNSVRAVPDFKVQEIFLTEYKNYEIISYKKNPWTGTVNQVHPGRVVDPETKKAVDVAIGFIKPGVWEKLKKEKEIIPRVVDVIDKDPVLRALGAPLIGPNIADIMETIKKEFDLVQKFENHKEGIVGYSGRHFWTEIDGFKFKVTFDVPGLIKPMESIHSTQLIVSKLAQGSSLQQATEPYNDMLPNLSRKIFDTTAKLWTQVGLFETGFFHIDLHPGNLLVQILDAEIKVTILDFGMVEKINKDYRANFFILGAGIELLKSSIIAKALWNLSEKEENKINFKNFVEMVNKRIQQLQGQTLVYNTEQWLAWATQVGIKFDSKFLNFQRGAIFINESLKKNSSDLSVLSMIAALAKAYPLKSWEYLRGGPNSIDTVDLYQLAMKQLLNQSRVIENRNLSKKKNMEIEGKDKEGLSMNKISTNFELFNKKMKGQEVVRCQALFK